MHQNEKRTDTCFERHEIAPQRLDGQEPGGQAICGMRNALDRYEKTSPDLLRVLLHRHSNTLRPSMSHHASEHHAWLPNMPTIRDNNLRGLSHNKRSLPRFWGDILFWALFWVATIQTGGIQYCLNGRVPFKPAVILTCTLMLARSDWIISL